MAKTYEEKQRDKRIQKQVENLGGPKKPPKPMTLKGAAKKQFTKAKLTTTASNLMPLAGFKKPTAKQKMRGFLKGYMGLYKEAVPKELRDRLKYEGKQYTKGSTSRKADSGD